MRDTFCHQPRGADAADADTIGAAFVMPCHADREVSFQISGHRKPATYRVSEANNRRRSANNFHTGRSFPVAPSSAVLDVSMPRRD